VLDLAAQQAGWGRPLAKGQGRGVAVLNAFGSYLAQVAEVTVGADGRVKIDRVVSAVDCGRIVNPDTVKAEIEGGIIFGITAALAVFFSRRRYVDEPAQWSRRSSCIRYRDRSPML
jgi:isoquinoline 1-oxidoreductase beta subunit